MDLTKPREIHSIILREYDNFREENTHEPTCILIHVLDHIHLVAYLHHLYGPTMGVSIAEMNLKDLKVLGLKVIRCFDIETGEILIK